MFAHEFWKAIRTLETTWHAYTSLPVRIVITLLHRKLSYCLLWYLGGIVGNLVICQCSCTLINILCHQMEIINFWIWNRFKNYGTWYRIVHDSGSEFTWGLCSFRTIESLRWFLANEDIDDLRIIIWILWLSSFYNIIYCFDFSFWLNFDLVVC